MNKMEGALWVGVPGWDERFDLSRINGNEKGIKKHSVVSSFIVTPAKYL